MEALAKTADNVKPANVKQAVPFFSISSMEQSLRYYLDGLGFQMTNKWIDQGILRWCWLEIGNASIMLQESHKKLEAKPGAGVSICFQCEDALAIYRQAKSRGLVVQTPFVGNQMWVTNLADPDGYKLSFESPTDVPEETVFSEQD